MELSEVEERLQALRKKRTRVERYVSDWIAQAIRTLKRCEPGHSAPATPEAVLNVVMTLAKEQALLDMIRLEERLLSEQLKQWKALVQETGA